MLQVPQATATVADLKKSVKRFVNLKLNRLKKVENRQKLISWKYIWKTYNLQFREVILSDNNAKLTEIGIKNKSCVSFKKRRKSDNSFLQ